MSRQQFLEKFKLGSAAETAKFPYKKKLEEYFQALEGAISHNTQRAIKTDLRIYTSWCEQNLLVALPVCAKSLAAFIDAMGRVKAPATVRRYVSSITSVHKAIWQKKPPDESYIKLALQRMHRQKGRRQAQVQGLTFTLRNRMIAASSNRLIDVRNRALVAVAYDTMLRRSELVSLYVSDLSVEGGGWGTMLVRNSKTDSEGKGATLYLAPDSVSLVQEWLSRSGVYKGRLFRSLRKNGRLGDKLDPSQVPRIFKNMARECGLPENIASGLSGHSARVGAVQDMIANGIELTAILQAGRWKTSAMVQRYGERLLAQRNGAAQLAKLQHRCG